ncbi:MAG: hypothetical protein AAF512_21985 [Pseudomonadota bacterium]
MIIALEGAPAVGKSTTAKYLAKEHGFYRVPEVNELFPTRPDPEPKDWYRARQLERFEIAAANQNSVLDGDPFQAIWFSWLYPGRGFADWSEVMAYFQAHAESIPLPSFYGFLYIDSEVRYERERGREMKRGHSHERFLQKWNRYADITGPHQAIFEAMAVEYPGWVVSLKTNDLPQVVNALLNTQPPEPTDPRDFTMWLASWLHANSPRNFR